MGENGANEDKPVFAFKVQDGIIVTGSYRLEELSVNAGDTADEFLFSAGVVNLNRRSSWYSLEFSLVPMQSVSRRLGSSFSLPVSGVGASHRSSFLASVKRFSTQHGLSVSVKCRPTIDGAIRKHGLCGNFRQILTQSRRIMCGFLCLGRPEVVQFQGRLTTCPRLRAFNHMPPATWDRNLCRAFLRKLLNSRKYSWF